MAGGPRDCVVATTVRGRPRTFVGSEVRARRCKAGRASPTQQCMKRYHLAAMLLGLAVSALAQEKTLVNVDKAGLALQGYDPVAFFVEHRPVKGRAEFRSVHQGATYQFAEAETKAQFDKEPDKYAPAFGGYCAYGVSRNKLVGVDVEAFEIVQGRLLRQYSKGTRAQFDKDPQGNLARADQNWPRLIEQKRR